MSAGRKASLRVNTGARCIRAAMWARIAAYGSLRRARGGSSTIRLPTCMGVSGVSSWRNSASSALRCLMGPYIRRNLPMDRKKAADFPPEVLELFDGYVHGRLSRRDFLDRAARYAVGGVTALGMLEMLSPNFALAQQVKADDARIRTKRLDYEVRGGSPKMRGYLVTPAKAGKAPGVVVIHENRGLNPYIEDVARRVAAAGYVAFAPDALAPVGGYPGDETKAREAFGKLDDAKRDEDLLAAYPALEKRPECNGRIGATGFCFGGGVVGMMATRIPGLAAAVPFYGEQPSAAETANIKAPLLIHYAENDPRINAGWPAWEQALKANKVSYAMKMYPGTQHGFHNDTTPRYDEAAAKLAWQRTLDFFELHLRG